MKRKGKVMKKIIFIFLFNYLIASDSQYSIIISNSSNEKNITINDSNSSQVIIRGKNIDLNHSRIESKTIIKNSIVIGNTGIYIGR